MTYEAVTQYLIEHILEIINLVIIGLAAWFGLSHVRHIKVTRDVEFMSHFDEKLVSEDHKKNRRMIYTSIPHPSLEKKVHENWLEKIVALPECEQIEAELYSFDRMGLFFRKADMDPELVLDLWFDVLARLTVLLQYFIRKKVEERGEGYMLNFRWLARRNIEYIKKKRAGPIKLKGIEITTEEISAAIKVLN